MFRMIGRARGRLQRGGVKYLSDQFNNPYIYFRALEQYYRLVLAVTQVSKDFDHQSFQSHLLSWKVSPNFLVWKLKLGVSLSAAVM